jgi:hypothetical protein
LQNGRGPKGLQHSAVPSQWRWCGLCSGSVAKVTVHYIGLFCCARIFIKEPGCRIIRLVTDPLRTVGDHSDTHNYLSSSHRYFSRPKLELILCRSIATSSPSDYNKVPLIKTRSQAQSWCGLASQLVSFGCAPKARVTSGGGFRPESCRLIW